MVVIRTPNPWFGFGDPVARTGFPVKPTVKCCFQLLSTSLLVKPIAFHQFQISVARFIKENMFFSTISVARSMKPMFF